MAKRKLPEIRIVQSGLLRNVKVLGISNKSYLSPDEQEEKIAAYQKAWRTKHHVIVTAMQELLGLTFYKNIIDVAVAPWQDDVGISCPLIVDCTSTPDEFIDTLTHELFHNLFTDNDVINWGDGGKDRLRWDELFGTKYNWTVIVHIAVHACLKYIYLDVLKEPSRLTRDIKKSDKYPNYKQAWDYVEQNDYKETIKQIKQSYELIRSQN